MMSEARISDSFLHNLISGAIGPATSDVVPIATDLRDARAEIARLKAFVEDRNDVISRNLRLNVEIARLARERDEASAEIASLINRAPDALRKLGTFLGDALDEDQFKTAEGMLLGGIARYDALLAERAGVSEADIRRIAADHGVNLFETNPAVFAYMTALLACLETKSISTPADRDAIRAEAMEEAAKIAEKWPGGLNTRDQHMACGQIAQHIRSAAKKEVSR